MIEDADVEYVSWGVGSFMDGKIYLNKSLKKYPKLHKRVLDHELKHLRGEPHVDWKEKASLSLWAFTLSHPGAWWEFSPLWMFNGIIYFDKMKFVWWGIILAGIAINYVGARWILGL